MNGCCMGMAMGNAHDEDCWWMKYQQLDEEDLVTFSEEELDELRNSD